MSIRVLLCVAYVLGFSIYAWRKWFVSLCAAILLMAVLEHPDMPRSLAGIQGLNLWNILMFNVLLSWWTHRNGEDLVWDMPGHVQNQFLFYFAVITVAFLRYLVDPSDWGEATAGFVVSEYFINCIKWVLPGLLLFDACRTRRRILIALGVVLGVYFLLSVQVIRWMPLSSAVSADFSARASKLIQNEIGYNRVTLSMMLGGASWAVLATLVLAKKRLHQLGILGAAGVVALGQALTGGRSGYLSWITVGVILCILRWRRLLPVIPIGIIAVLVFLPGVRERMLQGFGGTGGNIITQHDENEITSGRTLAWPYVIKKIQQSPVFGYGREAMITTGIFQTIQDHYGYGESFPHPHNAYLEVLLDNGVVGFLAVVPFYLIALWHSFRLLLDRNDPLFCAVGGVAASLILALMVAAMGGQTFYPREGAVGMWAAIGIMFRVSVERKRSLETGEPMFDVEQGETPESESDDAPKETVAAA